MKKSLGTRIIGTILLLTIIMTFSSCNLKLPFDIPGLTPGSGSSQTPGSGSSQTPGGGDDVIDHTPFELSEDLIKELNRLLPHVTLEGYPPYDKIGALIESIKSGDGACLINFENSETIFVCIYYDDGGDRNNRWFNNQDECTYVGFYNAESIPEYYDGKKCVESCQLNKASSSYDIITGKLLNTNIYRVQGAFLHKFENGFNVTKEIEYSETIISVFSKDYYGDYRSKTNVCFYGYPIFGEAGGLKCIKKDDKYYIKQIGCTVINGRGALETDVEDECGAYYDRLKKKIIWNECLETKEVDGNVYYYFYALINVEDFVSLIKE